MATGSERSIIVPAVAPSSCRRKQASPRPNSEFPTRLLTSAPRPAVKLFGDGELNRLIADALRWAEKPLGCADIAAAIIETKGYGRPAIHALTRRVRVDELIA